jgi:hypothetical protein
MGDLVHSRAKSAEPENAVVIGIDPNQAGVAASIPGAALIRVGRASDERV